MVIGDGEPATASELLGHAALLIEQATRELDTTYKRCANCRARVFSNYDHARVYEQLAVMPKKLRLAANRLLESKREGQ